MSPRVRLASLIVFAIIAVPVVFWLSRPRETERTTAAAALHTPVPLAALDQASGWLNGGAWGVDSLAAHPTLIVVWSDTDPVSLETLPEAEAWQRAYGRFGLRVIAVHMPEYAFASDSAVPARAAQRLGVHVPIALDGGLKISTQLGARETLPLWLLADRDGRLAFRAEGRRVAAVEAAIQELIRHDHPEAGLPTTATPSAGEPARVRRVFCGTSRVQGGPLVHAAPGRTETYTAQFRYQEEGEAYTPYPVGRWTPTSEGLTAARGGASDYLSIRYDSGAVEGVMGAAAGGAPMRVWVLCDEAWVPDSLRGADLHTDARGATYVEVDETRLYSITRAGGRHVLKLSPEAPGVTIHELAFVPE